MASFFLLTERFAHLPQALPCVLLACPLMPVCLLQWPSLLALTMFPVLWLMNGRLVMTEECDMQREFGAGAVHSQVYAAHR